MLSMIQIAQAISHDLPKWWWVLSVVGIVFSLLVWYSFACGNERNEEQDAKIKELVRLLSEGSQKSNVLAARKREFAEGIAERLKSGWKPRYIGTREGYKAQLLSWREETRTFLASFSPSAEQRFLIVDGLMSMFIPGLNEIDTRFWQIGGRLLENLQNIADNADSYVIEAAFPLSVPHTEELSPPESAS